MNTSTPALRFGGIAVQDSGSLASGLTGSLLWDSQTNNWIYSNPSGSGNYDSAMVMMGPQNSGALGTEVGLTLNAIPKGAGGHHMTSSAIFEVSGSVGIGTTAPSGLLNLAVSSGATIMTIDNVAAQYGNIIFRESSVGKAYVQYISPTFSTTIRQNSLEFGTNAASSFIAFRPVDTEAMRITSAGNVGIGTTNPSSKLHLYDGTNPLSLKIQRTSVPVYLSDIATGATTAGAAWTHNVENTSNGSVSWGSFNNAGYAGSAILLNSNPSTSYITLHTANNVNTNPTERIRITGEGYVNINSDTGNSMGTAALNIHQSGSGAGTAGNQIWVKGGNSTDASGSNAVVLSYSTGLQFPHAIKTVHNAAAIKGNAIDFYVWNYGTDSTTTIGTRKMMSVDGAGVVKPLQPYFKAHVDSTKSQQIITNNADATINFDIADVNIGSNFNTSTYRFTAPVTGRYLFTAQVRYDTTSTSASYMRTFFTINGSTGNGTAYNFGMAILGPSAYSLSYQSISTSATLQLAAGDWVDVRGGINSGTTGVQFESTFTGYLLG
jgi:hypothetical protein